MRAAWSRWLALGLAAVLLAVLAPLYVSSVEDLVRVQRPPTWDLFPEITRALDLAIALAGTVHAVLVARLAWHALSGKWR